MIFNSGGLKGKLSFAVKTDFLKSNNTADKSRKVLNSVLQYEQNTNVIALCQLILPLLNKRSDWKLETYPDCFGFVQQMLFRLNSSNRSTILLHFLELIYSRGDNFNWLSTKQLNYNITNEFQICFIIGLQCGTFVICKNMKLRSTWQEAASWVRKSCYGVIRLVDLVDMPLEYCV